MVDAPHRRQSWVLLAVFGAALLCSLAIAGQRASGASANPHYAHMAQGWLHGRLSLPDKPPGYCTTELRRAGRCKHHSYDDWAVVWTLQLDDGSSFRGYPCKTSACAKVRRQGLEPWLDMHGSRRDIPRAQIESRDDTWFVSFPPGPAAMMLPFVAMGGLGVWDVLLTALFAGLAPVLIVLGLDRQAGRREDHHLWIAAAWALASPALFVGAHGSVWFTAQSMGALFALAYVFDAQGARHPARAGLWLALAMSCRPHAALGVLWFAQQWWGEGRDLRKAARFAAPLLVVGLAMAAHNYARFDNPFEFGHRFLDIRWQARMQEHGQFSLIYLGRNLECLLWLWPQFRGEFPWLAVSLHGSALWIMSPWLFALGGAGEAARTHWALWLSALLIALPALLYHNSGQRQLSYRFALDWLPYLLPLLATSPWTRGRAFRAAVIVGALLCLSSAWYFDRAPGRVFVADPLGWPFEAEFKR